ncbi:hypothetical protein E1A91_A13G101800v1 [Gossypium mustelinum]|uniref:Uncharacterized protein n=1 Tax=Gossypium mustelinum TaxID=34275 RepID=A0A5D2WGL0_GOSMU|nr:hypothetical protein E1A91_A13G101800v1 [Gossypium mustelinum]
MCPLNACCYYFSTVFSRQKIDFVLYYTNILSYRAMGFDAYARLSTQNIAFLTKLSRALALSYCSVLPSLTLC